MSKSIKLKNNNYWDSTGVIHNRQLLSDILPIGFLRGTYDVLVNSWSISGTVTDKYLETRYRFKDTLLQLFPTNSHFDRKYILISNLNTSDRTQVHIKLGGVLLRETSVWGTNTINCSLTDFKDVTTIINNLGTGHKNVTTSTVVYDTPAPSTVFAYIQSCKLYVYDIPK